MANRGPTWTWQLAGIFIFQWKYFRSWLHFFSPRQSFYSQLLDPSCNPLIGNMFAWNYFDSITITKETKIFRVSAEQKHNNDDNSATCSFFFLHLSFFFQIRLTAYQIRWFAFDWFHVELSRCWRKKYGVQLIINLRK
jgi:hypothetical protein